MTVKELIKNSPVGPLAVRLYGSWRNRPTKQERELRKINAQYDRETAEVMGRILKADSSCIDVGAHKGTVLEEMIRIAPLGKHFAFEPLPHFASHLRERFPGVETFEAAASDYSATGESFVHVEDDPAYSGLKERVYPRPNIQLKRILVQVVRIDDVIPHDRTISFIKLDIEGSEYHALCGAVETIKRCKPLIVFEASSLSTGKYGVTPVQFFGFLDMLGYHLSTMRRWLSGEPPLDVGAFSTNWFHGPDFYFVAYPHQQNDRRNDSS